MSKRWIVNTASLLAICGGVLALGPTPGYAAAGTSTGMCCAQAGSVCVTYGPDGQALVMADAYYWPGPGPCPAAAVAPGEGASEPVSVASAG